MGWFHDEEPGHEGYVNGQTREGGLWLDVNPPQDFRGKRHVEAVQAACECGWRSPRYQAPWGTTWSPRSIDLPASPPGEQVEAGLRRLWSQHMAAILEPAKLDEVDKLGEPLL